MISKYNYPSIIQKHAKWNNLKYVFKYQRKRGLSLMHPIYSFGVDGLNEGHQSDGLEHPSHSLSGQKIDAREEAA